MGAFLPLAAGMPFTTAAGLLHRWYEGTQSVLPLSSLAGVSGRNRAFRDAIELRPPIEDASRLHIVDVAREFGGADGGIFGGASFRIGGHTSAARSRTGLGPLGSLL